MLERGGRNTAFARRGNHILDLAQQPLGGVGARLRFQEARGERRVALEIGFDRVPAEFGEETADVFRVEESLWVGGSSFDGEGGGVGFADVEEVATAAAALISC